MPLFFRKQRKESKAKLEHCWQLARTGPGDFIDFSECDLHEIPEGTYATCRVLLKRALILSENRLESLKESGSYEDLEKLQNLAVLDLHCNHLHSLPPSLGNLYSLQVVNLENNRLHDLPLSFAQLVSLQTLNLKHNRFKSLPQCICELTSLRTLDISQNNVTKLPESLWKCRCLETVVLDAAEMEIPSADICLQGTPAIMKHLCTTAEVDYIAPSKALLTVLNTLATPSPNILRGGSMHAPRDESHYFDASIRQYEKEKEAKRKQQLELEKSLHEAQEAQAALVANSVNHHRQLMEILAQVEKDDTDRRMKDVQHSKDIEKANFLEILQHMETHSQNLTTELLTFNQQARKSELLLEEEEKRRKADENWFKIHLDDYNNLRRKEIESCMEQMLASNFGLEQLRIMSDKKRKANLEHTMSEGNDQSTALQASLVARDREMARLVSNLLREEAFQKEALEALMTQRDARTQRISGQIRLIQEELAKVTCVELKNKALRISDNVKILDHQRQDLSLMLMQLIREKERRSKEISAELAEMERHKQDELSDYWLIQFQRLKDSKPTSLADAEKLLDPEIVMLLQKSEADDYISAFARHHVTMKVLFTLTEEDLQKIGIYSIGLRRTVLSNIEKLSKAKDSKDNLKAKSLVSGDNNIPGTSTGSEASGTTRPDHMISVRLEVECVVCLDLPSAVVLIPCGHVCVCGGCSRSLTVCPMCRGSIMDKVDLSGIQPSAPTE